MPDRIVLDHVALVADGPSLALRLTSGQSMAVVGRAGAGKSRFLAVLGQQTAPGRGSVHLSGQVFTGWTGDVGRRVKLQTLANSDGPGAAERAAHALSATGLWNYRKNGVTELSPGHRHAAELLPTLVSTADVVLIDGLLDALDPWTLNDVVTLLKRRMREGLTVCIATNRPGLAAQMDVLVVLQDQQVRFAGSPADLIRSATVSRLEVHSESQAAVRALVRPFEVTITEADGALRLEAAEGQQVAAKLLLEGYGDVRFVVLTQATVETALLALL